jgi:thiosulfate dehydrogenase [quinone] large subunit
MTAYFKGAKGSWMWLVIRLYLGYQWVEASWHKITGATPFDASGFLKGAIANSVPKTPGAKPVVQAWWGSFLQTVALPNAKLFSFMVQYGELLVGLALLVGFATLFAATMGMIMNFAFLLSGTVSSNANLLFLEVILLTLGGAYAGYLGVDYWFRPLYRNYLARLFGNKAATTTKVA